MDRRKFLAGTSAVAATALMKTPAHAAMDEFVAYDGMGQAALVHSGQVSPAELADAAIKRIEKLNPVLNAVIYKMYEEGRAAADGPLPDGPFKGVPYLIKDISELKGAPLTFGSKLFASNIADRDNGSVVRAKEAGLVILGKTNTPEFGFISTTESQLFGAARNPYDTAYHTGGSSGGAAAAVASGMVPFAHASDGGGSIRIPASICGLVGLKPSRGRLFTNSPQFAAVDIGVRLAVTRTVRDTAQILNVSERKDAAAPLDPVGFVRGASGKRLKIAFFTKTYDGREPHPDVKLATERTARMCQTLGHYVDQVDAATVVDGGFLDNFMNVWSKAAYDLVENARLIGLTQGRWVSSEDTLEKFTHGLADLFRARVEKDDKIIDKAVAYCDKVAADYDAFFEDYDVILSPVLMQPPLLIGEQGSHKDFDELYASVLDYVLYTAQYNAAGNPAISLPLHRSQTGLPIGTQFAAKTGNDAMLLELAYELEGIRPWHKRWPPISAEKL